MREGLEQKKEEEDWKGRGGRDRRLGRRERKRRKKRRREYSIRYNNSNV